MYVCRSIILISSKLYDLAIALRLKDDIYQREKPENK